MDICQASVRDVGVAEAENLKALEVLDFFQAGVGDGGEAEVEPPEGTKLPQNLEVGVRDLGAGEVHIDDGVAGQLVISCDLATQRQDGACGLLFRGQGIGRRGGPLASLDHCLDRLAPRRLCGLGGG